MSEKKNPILLYIIGGLIVGVLIWQGTFRLVHPKHQQELEAKIQETEIYYEKAKALSISMPLLSDSIIYSYADGLLMATVSLNKDWVRYVATQDDFKRYTEEIEELTRDLDVLRIEYEMIRTLRGIQRNLEQIQPRQWNDKKKSTEV